MIRGNLMAIPIERSFLYVEPVYLQARQESESEQERAGAMTRQSMQRPARPSMSTALPELKQVIVSYGNEVVMRENLTKALSAIFKESVALGGVPSEEKVETVSVKDLVHSAMKRYREAQEFLKAGDWAGYGQALDQVETLLEELLDRAGGAPAE